MSLADSLYEACRVVRQGGLLQPEACQSLQAAVTERRQSLQRQLEDAALPAGFASLQELVEEALSDCSDAVGALTLACQEDSPEFASWALEKAQSAEDIFRRVRQVLAEHSAMLCEESVHGDF